MFKKVFKKKNLRLKSSKYCGTCILSLKNIRRAYKKECMKLTVHIILIVSLWDYRAVIGYKVERGCYRAVIGFKAKTGCYCAVIGYKERRNVIGYKERRDVIVL